MSVLARPSSAVFDEHVRAEIRLLTEESRGREALDRLAQFDPESRDERIHFHGLRAKAYGQLGDSARAISEWVRALHLTSHSKALRPRVRICLADTFTFTGEYARAERMVQRCVAEIRAAGGDPLEPWALSSLAHLHLTRGNLSLAVRLYDSATSLLGENADLTIRVALTVNYSLALMRWGELARADEVLARISGPEVEAGLKNVAPLFLTRAMLAMESEDVDRAQGLLARADDRIVGDDLRHRRIRTQIDVQLKIRRGRFREALQELDEAPPTPQRANTARLSDIELPRLRALALLGLGRPEEALEAAMFALRSCGGVDTLDRSEVLRAMARCLDALGRRAEARQRLATAFSILESTEFVLERCRLYRDMEALGMPVPVGQASRRDAESSSKEPSQTVHRFELRDGRRFITTDGELVARIHQAAESRLPVLLEGETGTGKELVARMLHEMGTAREGPFVVVDCTTLTESLADAELFGTARGAYTGAIADRDGLVGSADRGTLLFDELPELSLPAQSKLLRLLQEGTYRRLGEARPRAATLRVIAATNQDTGALLARGALKPDLFFRLHGYRIRLRPLRDRPLDVALLAREFAMAEGLSGVTEDALLALRACPWPGNVRQLEMLVRVAASRLEPGRWLDRDRVAPLLEEAPKTSPRSGEADRLKAALDLHAGNVAATARALGMSRQGLYKALRRNGLI